MARSLSFATGRHCRAGLHCVTLLSLIALAITTVSCIPAHAPGSIPDKWAQLLHADRYNLIQLPERRLHGGPPDPSLPNTFRYSAPSNTSAPEASMLRAIPIDSDFRDKASSRAKYEGPRGSCQFVCEVVDAPDGLDVESALGIALTTMSTAWESAVTVTMILKFENLGNESILASGGGSYFVQLGSPLPDDIIIPIGSAEAIRGVDMNGDKEGDQQYDVIVTVNSVTPWYAGSGSPSEDQYDLATVLLHEIYHNLVFSGSVVAEKNSVSGTVQQTAYLYKGYKTRFDMFLATQAGCGVLQYLTAEDLARSTGMSTAELLAQAVCSNLLFFAVGNSVIAKLHAPNVFQFRSSIYHIDQAEVGESVMFPAIRRGTMEHTVGPKIIQIQKATLDAGSQVSSTSCLPTPVTQPDQPGAGGFSHDNTTQREPEVIPIGGARVGGLPVWGFVLLIILAVILLLLLLLICLLLCLRRRRRRQSERQSEFRSSKYSSYFSGGKGGAGKTDSRRDSSSKKSDSWGKWSKHSKSSRHSRHSRHSHHSKGSSRKPESERFPSKDGEKCPSTGKNVFVCCCDCCKPSLTRPPPIASVHQWEPDSVICVEKDEDRCKKKKKKHCRHRHDHHHGVEKVVKKVCKTKKVCPENASSSRQCAKTTKCTTTVTKKPCRRVPPSTRPPSTRVASHCVERAPCVPVAPVCVPTTPVCVPTTPVCVPATTCTPTTYTTRNCTTMTRTCTPTRSRSQRNCAPTTTTCTPTSTVRSCRTCKKTRNKCCCKNKVEVNVEYRC